MNWWPWRRRREGPTDPEHDTDAQQALAKAQGELQRAEDQTSAAEHLAHRANEAVKRANRFTQDVDRALRLRESR